MGSLAQATEVRLHEWIMQQQMRGGDKLPAEHVLTAQLGVSRTVLREAVAGLRARGELTSRRGSGVFVANPGQAGLMLAPADIAAVPDVLADLEMRAAVETEAASLAARRRSDSDLLRIEQAIAQQAEAQDAEAASRADWAFHHAIARATQNARFVAFLDGLGLAAIPRARLRHQDQTLEQAAAYAGLLIEEHRAIARGIINQDAGHARDAMRHHLMGSAKRYKLAAEIAGQS